MAKLKGSTFLAQTFLKADVGAIFFVPTFLYPTLVELGGTGVRRVLCHAEKAAAYMADGYSQAAGKPGIVITQGGPGAVNLASGFGDPWQSGSSVIGLTSLIPVTRYRRNSYQEVYVDFRPVTKYDAEVRSLDRLPDILGQAFREATTGATGPAHLYVAGGIEAEEIETPEFMEPRYTRYPAFRPQADERDVEAAARRLREAQRPVIVAGRGAIRSGAWAEVTALAEKFHIPVATSLGGKGSIDEKHPLAIGVVGSYRRPATNTVVGKADLVLFVGSHVGGAIVNMRECPPWGTPIIHIDIDPAQPGKNYPDVTPLIGDARAVLQQMLEATDKAPADAHAAWIAEAQATIRDWWAKENAHVTADAAPIRPERLAVELVKAVPNDTIVVVDTGYAAAWGGAFMDLPAGKNFLACEGSMGWSFPAAIGAKCGAPERPVVTWVGDGGFWCHLPELETAVRYGIKVVTVVMNNHALVFDTHLLQHFWSGSAHIDELSEFRDVDFGAVAREMGAYGVRVTDPRNISSAIQKALAAEGPAVIDFVIDHEAIAPVAVLAGQASRAR
ncbi:MAG: thiamine pyrophosphate-binding protein [Chloroflexi bacterium]|nr:thiamine pyrophosphate-binding protein [Chloroflexota bacterium]